MSCFHPLIAYPGKLTEKGKVKYIPVPYESGVYEYIQSKEWIEVKQELSKKIGNDFVPPIMLPCGKCIGCRLDKSREWALRCMMELKTQNGLAKFITLTYNDTKVPRVMYPDPETGEALTCYSLKLDDLQRFWKRLRKAFPDAKIRYFASGEYGSETWRPHYHAIVYGLDIPDLVFVKNAENGKYYESNTLNRIWSNGCVIVADVSFDTCAYVARYTAKKNLTLPDKFFEYHGLEKPFLVMSRRPGIGWQYMNEHKNFFDLDKIYVDGEEPIDGRLPRSFIRKLEEIDPELYKDVTERRKYKGNVYEKAIAMTRKVPYYDMMIAAEANLVARCRKITRNKV